jgi:hypothetical protein
MTRIGRFAIEASLEGRIGCDNCGMPLERTPQKLPGDALHTGPGVRYTPGARVGPDIIEPPIKPAAQSKRASQIQRNAPDGTAARPVGRSFAYPGQPANYGST